MCLEQSPGRRAGGSEPGMNHQAPGAMEKEERREKAGAGHKLRPKEVG